MNLTLRIKKVYFDAIANGSKKYEYRSDSDFYRKIFQRKSEFKTLTLHYQKPERLTCKIKNIKLIKNNLKGVDPSFFGTEKIFRIEIYEPISWLKK